MLGRHARPDRDLDPRQHAQDPQRRSRIGRDRCCWSRPGAGALCFSGDRESDAIDAAGLAQARERFALLGRDVSQLSDDQLHNLVAELERRFRDEALTSAAQAATIILDGVKADRWRILVGADAHKIDEMVRQSPERAYDIAFFDEFARAAGWSERLRALIDRVIEQMLATGHVRWASSGAPLVRRCRAAGDRHRRRRRNATVA